VASSRDFAIFTDHGYMGLYNGEKARDIHARNRLSKGQRILDWMGHEELADNLFRQVQAEARIRREGIEGKDAANQAHHEVGQVVRATIAQMGGTMPEDLPTPEISVAGIAAARAAEVAERADTLGGRGGRRRSLTRFRLWWGRCLTIFYRPSDFDFPELCARDDLNGDRKTLPQKLTSLRNVVQGA
jgi:hypothetical protein